MSTVGRMGLMFAAMNVLTRSRGTPAAARARYLAVKEALDIPDVDRSLGSGRGQPRANGVRAQRGEGSTLGSDPIECQHAVRCAAHLPVVVPGAVPRGGADPLAARA